MNNDALRDMLVIEEGFRPSAYQDHLGYWTIGIGRLVDVRKNGGITFEEANYLLENDIAKRTAALVSRPWWAAIADDPVRRAVLQGMAFQMGVDGLSKFYQFLRSVQERRFEDASREMLQSLWAKQTPQRAGRMSEMMRTGVLLPFYKVKP